MAGLNLSVHTILVAEDEAFSRQILVRMLSSMGSPRIHQAANGEEALNCLWKERSLSFVISDLNMPVLNGLQVLKALRTGQCGVDRATPFAMLTGYSDRDLVEAALKLDVNSFVIKPISKEALEKRLEHLLGFANDTSWIRPVAAYQRVDTRAPGGGSGGAVESRRDAPQQSEEPQEARTDGDAVVGWSRAGAGRAGGGGRGRKGSGARFAESDLVGGKLSARFGEPDLAGDGESTYRRLSALRGKFQDSDLAGDIAAGVSHLVAEIGDQGAARVVGVLDALQRRGDLSLDDIAAVLAPSAASGRIESRPARMGERVASGTEEFRELGDVPVGAVLSRDITLRDGNVFVRAEIVLSPLIVSLLTHLDSLKVLALPTADGAAGKTGIYVRVPAGLTDSDQSTASIIALRGRPRQVEVGDIPAGSIAARGIYTVDGNLYLPAGEQITPRVVSLLQDLKELGKLNDKIWVVA